MTKWNNQHYKKKKKIQSKGDAADTVGAVETMISTNRSRLSLRHPHLREVALAPAQGKIPINGNLIPATVIGRGEDM